VNKLNPIEIVQKYHNNSSNKIIILLENEWQVRDCISWINEINSEKVIIALSPFAMYELDKQNIPYHSIDKYYKLIEYLKFGADNYQKCENLCEIIDKKIHEKCQIIEKNGLTPALFSFYSLKKFYDAITLRLFQLSTLIDCEKADALFIYDSKTSDFELSEDAEFDLSFDNRESIYAQILALSGWNIDIIFLPSNIQPKYNLYFHTKDNDIFRKKLISWLNGHPKLYNLALSVRKAKFDGLKKIIFSRKNPVLIFSAGYNWDDCMEELYRVKIGPVYRMQDSLNNLASSSDEILIEALYSVWDELRVDKHFCDFFKWNNIDFFAIVECKFKNMVEKHTITCLNTYEEVSEFLINKEIKAILFSTISTCTAHSAAKAAHNLHIPVVSWQHGGYGYMNHRIIDYLDFMSSDFHFVFGNGVVIQHEKSAKQWGTSLIPVGSASLDVYNCKKASTSIKQKLKLKVNKKSILYVTTHLLQNDMYTTYMSTSTPSDPLFDSFSDNSLWKIQQSIIDVLGKQTGYNVIIKTHPNNKYREPPIRSYIKEKGYSNLQVIGSEFSATDLIPIADILVVDTIATVVLQMLTTSKPMFVYTGRIKIDDIAGELLKQRAHSFFNLNEFTAVLDTFLDTGAVDRRVDLADRQFLEMYGTHLDDGTSGKIAARELKGIFEKNQSKRC